MQLQVHPRRFYAITLLLLSRFLVVSLLCLPAQYAVAQVAPLQRFYEKGKVGYKDEQGRVVVAPEYDAGSAWEHGYAIVVRNGRRGYINSKGILQIPLIYRDAHPFTAGYAAVKLADRYGFIDETGNWVVEPVYEAIYPFAVGRALIKRGGRYGFVDTSLREVIAPVYPLASGFSEGMALVWDADGRCRFIDEQGKTAIVTAFDDAHPFHGGRAEVLLQGKWYTIDRAGVKLTPLPASAVPVTP